MHELLVVGPFPWSELGLSRDDWPSCRVTEARREADALAVLEGRAFDVVLTSPNASASRLLGIAKNALRLQPGVRVIILASAPTPTDILDALKADVYAIFTVPVAPPELRQVVRDALVASEWRSGIEVQSAVPRWIGLRVACRRVTAERLTLFMNELAGDLPESDRYQLITAFREVLLNAMEHGAGFDPDKIVEVAAVRTQRTLVYYFKDPGKGFNPHELDLVASEGDPLSHLDARATQGVRPGGFGLMLASKLVDEVHFSEKGNEVILVKHLE
jgi:anti-sigma regulatory factor (Ser/Thr protein kinase)/CheY-like chemotaxis protein